MKAPPLLSFRMVVVAGGHVQCAERPAQARGESPKSERKGRRRELYFSRDQGRLEVEFVVARSGGLVLVDGLPVQDQIERRGVRRSEAAPRLSPSRCLVR